MGEWPTRMPRPRAPALVARYAPKDRSVRRLRRDERGAELVEFALVVPLLVVLLFGLVDFGLVFGGYTQLRASVQASARAASLGDYAYAGPGTCTGGPDMATAGLVCNLASSLLPLMGTASGSLRVGICFVTPGSIPSCDEQTGPGTSLTEDVEVCAEATMHSSTGITAPIIDGRTVSSSNRLVIEQPAPSASTTFGAYNASSDPVTFNGQVISGMKCT